MTQQLLVYILLGLAVIYIIYKFAFKRLKKKAGDKDCDNCP